jgi:aspartate carbamoyltransferase regulatory subunit
MSSLPVSGKELRMKPIPRLTRFRVLSKGTGPKELYVKKIRNGTVIDHILAGHALDVLKILGIDGREGHIVSVAMNVISKKQNKKDIVKVENRELKPGEVDKIALISPSATISIIRDYEVAEKTRVKLPDSIRGIVRCSNPACVSNAEPVEPKFSVERQDPLRLRCYYCVRIMEKIDVLKQF